MIDKLNPRPRYDDIYFKGLFNMNENKKTCQMTIAGDFVSGRYSSLKCDRPAKFRVPNPKMGVEYVCGIHARSLDKMFERTEQNTRCIPL